MERTVRCRCNIEALQELGWLKGKNVSVGAIPRLTVKLGLLKEVSESVDAISRLTNLMLRGLSGRKGE